MIARIALALFVPFALVACSSEVEDPASSQEAAVQSASSLTVSSCTAQLSGKEAAYKAANKPYPTTLPRDGSNWFCGQAGESLTAGLYLRVAPDGATFATRDDVKLPIAEKTATPVTLSANLDDDSVVYAQVGSGSYSPFGKYDVATLRKMKTCTVRIIGVWKGDAATGGYEKRLDFTCS